MASPEPTATVDKRHRRGADHPRWRGGEHIDGQGYIRVTLPDRRRVRKQRLVMEAHLGRPLRREEVVHHRNGDKTDNRIENLELISQSEHVARHARRPNLTGHLQRVTVLRLRALVKRRQAVMGEDWETAKAAVVAVLSQVQP